MGKKIKQTFKFYFLSDFLFHLLCSCLHCHSGITVYAACLLPVDQVWPGRLELTQGWMVTLHWLPTQKVFFLVEIKSNPMLFLEMAAQARPFPHLLCCLTCVQQVTTYKTQVERQYYVRIFFTCCC